MRSSSALLLLLAACWAAEARADEHASVRVEAEHDVYYVGQPIRLRLAVRYDPGYFAEHAVSLFRREVDVPMLVSAPHLRELPGATALPRGDSLLPGRARVAVNDRVEELTHDVGASPAKGALLSATRWYLPQRPGELVVPAPTLRFAVATLFEEDFLGGRVPLDRREVFVRGEPLTLEVRELPSEGRPATFDDAVGHFRVTASVDRTEVSRSESLFLTLRIEGEGNLEVLTPPAADRVEGFHVFGVLDDRGRPVRTLRYEIAPLGPGVGAVPAIPFAFFEPGPPGVYRVLRTEAIPLELPAAEDAPPSTEGEPGGTPVFALLGVVLLLGAAVYVGRRVRLRHEPEADPRRQRVEAAAAALRSSSGDADVFAEFLAAHLDCPAAAVIAPDLRARLTAAGLDAALAARAVEALDRRVDARYRGAEAAHVREVVDAALVDDLEAGFGRTSAPP